MKSKRPLFSIALLLVLALWFAPVARAQSCMQLAQGATPPYVLGLKCNFTASSAPFGAFNTAGITYWQVVFVPSGTVSAASLSFDSSTTGLGGSWTTGGILPAATIGSMTSSGSYGPNSVATTPSNYGQLTPIITGSGSVQVVLYGYTTSPGGGSSITGTPAVGTQVVGNGSGAVYQTQSSIDARNFNVSCAASGNPPAAVTTTISGTQAPGASIAVVNSNSFAANQGIYIAGAGVAGANYVGSIVSVNSNLIVISPATSTSVTNALVQHDESAALNAIIASVAVYTLQGKIVLPAGICNFNGPLLNTGAQNAIVSLPIITYSSTAYGPALAIDVEGTVDEPDTYVLLSGNTATPHTQGTIIQTASTSGNLFATATSGGTYPFSAIYPTFKNLTFRTPQNPSIAVLQCAQCAGLRVEDSTFDVFQGGTITSSAAQPTNSNGIAIYAPQANNGADTYIKHVAISGFYSGLICGEHCVVDSIDLLTNWQCFVNGTGAHANYINHIGLQECAYGIMPNASANSPLYVSQITAEQSHAGWWSTATNAALIYDPNSWLSGTINLGFFNNSTGVNLKFGGNNVTVTNTTTPSPTLGNLVWGTYTLGDFGQSPTDSAMTVINTLNSVAMAFGTSPHLYSNNGVITSNFNFTGKTVGVRVPILTADPQAVAQLVIGADSQNWLAIQEYNNAGAPQLAFNKKISNTQTGIATLNYDQTKMLYWKMSESSGTITASYSADGISWTTIGSTTVSWGYTATHIELEIGAGAVPATPSPGYTVFDQFFIGTINSAPVGSSSVTLTSDFTDANASGLQAITGLSFTMAPNILQTRTVDCYLMYSQATNVSDSFGVQDVTVAPTRIDGTGLMTTAGPGTSITAAQYGVLTNLTTTTATAIVTATPTVTTVNRAELHFTVQQPANSSSSVLQIMLSQATAADVIVIKAGSTCRMN